MGTCKVEQLKSVQHLPWDQDEPKIRLFPSLEQDRIDKSFLHRGISLLISEIQLFILRISIFKAGWLAMSGMRNPRGGGGGLLREEASMATTLFLLDLLLFLLLLLLFVLFFTGFKTRKSNSAGKGDQHECCNCFLHNLKI